MRGDKKKRQNERRCERKGETTGAEMRRQNETRLNRQNERRD